MKTILIMESEPMVRALYYLELRDEGYQVLMAQNDQEALHMLKSRPVDLLITEMGQCDDGAISRKNAFFRDIPCPVIINTGYPNDFMRFFPFKQISHILKSSNIEKLKEHILLLLGGSESLTGAGQKTEADFQFFQTGALGGARSQCSA